MKVWSRHIQETITEIEDHLLQEYKENKVEKERDWRTYEQKLFNRIKFAIRNLEPLIEEAISTIKISKGKGRTSKLTLKQKVILLLIKELFDKSNRNMSCMLDIFSLLSGIDISYKSVERLYSDPIVEMAIHNLHTLLLRKRGINNVDVSGDGTGYSLSIRKHYASEVEKRHDEAKKVDKKEGRMRFVYSFKLLDLKSKMYIAYGMSLRSEKDAFNKSKEMLDGIGIDINSIRLDRYYSNSSDVEKFPDSWVYVFPKSNATLRGKKKWKRTMERFVLDTMNYLEQYYLRNNSESEISVDKRWFGWRIHQRRPDRMEVAHSCDVIWHNLFRLYE